jgi:hypothetical protein
LGTTLLTTLEIISTKTEIWCNILAIELNLIDWAVLNESDIAAMTIFCISHPALSHIVLSLPFDPFRCFYSLRDAIGSSAEVAGRPDEGASTPSNFVTSRACVEHGRRDLRSARTHPCNAFDHGFKQFLHLLELLGSQCYPITRSHALSRPMWPLGSSGRSNR